MNVNKPVLFQIEIMKYLSFLYYCTNIIQVIFTIFVFYEFRAWAVTQLDFC